MFPVTIDPLATNAAWIVESDQANAKLGVSVSTAGDVNGDGYSDVIVGAPYYDNGETDEGRVYAYHGSASGLSATPNWTSEGNQAGARFGQSVSTAGDVNGDGYSDVIVGADAYDNGQTDEGRAYVYLGSPSGLNGIAAWAAESNQASAYFGCSVSTAGDVNGDGYGDVIIGAYSYDTGLIAGRAYVYLGSALGPSATAAWTADGLDIGVEFGWSVSTAGDVNGDGFSDVIVGANKDHNGQSMEGRAFVYLGSASGLSMSPAWTAESNQSSAQFGRSVSTAGDVNGDGYSDVIVGANGYNNGQSGEGRAYVYLGSASGLSTSPAWTAESNQAAAYFGWSVSTAGDVNGDGYSDVIVGAHIYDNGQTDEGRAYVYLGSASGLSLSPAWTDESNQTYGGFAFSVSTAGDVNGDGYSDVIVGALWYGNGQTQEGRAYLYYGSASGLSTATASRWIAESDQANADYGISVSSAGDVNGDGYGDVIVGAPYYDNGQTDEGRAYLYHGSSSGVSATPNWIAESDQANANFGISLSSAGDVNGDGYADVIVGAHLYDNGEADEGRAYVYHGSVSGLSVTPNWIAESDQAGAEFGRSVSSAGDVNGDGYADVIVGAHLYDNGEDDEGRAYVYYGSASGLSTSPKWTAESDQVNADFGFSVSSAGDVNGDGYADVMVGAPLYDNGETDEGRVFLYCGSVSGLNAMPNWTVESNQASASFGASVSSAGDVNGDGYADVIVGAYGSDNGQTDEGCAYVYYGSGSGPSVMPDWTAESDQVSADLGRSVSSAGDVNGDGYADVVVGAPLYDNGETDEGRVFLYFGSVSGLNTTPNWTVESNQASARLGYSASSAGDVNGDGYADVIVGTYLYDNGQTDEGRAIVYYGNGEAGRGLSLKAQQRRVDDAAPLGHMAQVDSMDYVRIAMIARTPFGRSKVKQEVEVKPLGVPFDGTDTIVSDSWVPVAVGGSDVELLAPLPPSPTGVYHWRTRLRYNPVDTPYQQYSRWMTVPWNGAQEGDFRVDVTPPETGTVTSDTGDFTNNNLRLDFSWSGFQDPGTRIAEYLTGFGSVAEPELYRPFTSVGLTSSCTFRASEYPAAFPLGNFPDAAYACAVKAVNELDMISAPGTASVTVDTVPPTLAISSPNIASTRSGPVRFDLAYSDANGFSDISLDTSDISLVRTGDADAAIAVEDGTTPAPRVVLSAITGEGALAIDVSAGTATDRAGNPVSQTGPSVAVSVDKTAPIITLSVPGPVQIDRFSLFDAKWDTAQEPAVRRVEAFDAVDGNLFNEVQTDYDPNITANVGIYPVTYRVSDHAGNAATEVILSVEVVDNQPPGTVLEPNPGSGVYVRSEAGFVTQPRSGQPNLICATVSGATGDVEIGGALFFLRMEVDGCAGPRYLRWEEGGTVIEGNGDLYVRGNVERLLLSGAFRLDLVSGRFDLTPGAAFVLNLPFLGTLSDMMSVGLLGLGDYATCSRTGIAVQAASESTVGGLGKLMFPHLFIGSFGGQYHTTFGEPGLSGLAVTEGVLEFDVPQMALRLLADHVNFSSSELFIPDAEVEITNGTPEPYRVNIANLTITASRAFFGESITALGLANLRLFDSDLDTVAGTIGLHAPAGFQNRGPGVYADAAQIAGMTLRKFFASQAGLEFQDADWMIGGFGARLQGLRVNMADPIAIEVDKALVTAAGATPTGDVQFSLEDLSIPIGGGEARASSGRLTLGDPADPEISLDVVATNMFSLREIERLRLTLKRWNTTTELNLAHLSQNSVTFHDSEEFDVYGVKAVLRNISFGPVGLGAGVLEFPDWGVGLRNLTLGLRVEDCRIGGGSWTSSAGFTVEIGAQRLPDNAWVLTGAVGLPMWGTVGASLHITVTGVYLTNIDLRDVNYGLLRVKDVNLQMDPEQWTASGRIGYGDLPDMTGQVVLADGTVQEICMGTEFLAPSYPLGYPLYPPFVFLQQLDGCLTFPGAEAHVLLSGGPRLTLWLIGGPYYLFTLDGQARYSSLGYLAAMADARLFNTLPVAGCALTAGNIYEAGRQVGRGFKVKGETVPLFGGFLNGRVLGWGYQGGTTGVSLDGSLRIPEFIPKVHGKVCDVHLALDTSGFRGKASVKMCAPFRVPCGIFGWRLPGLSKGDRDLAPKFSIGDAFHAVGSVAGGFFGAVSGGLDWFSDLLGIKTCQCLDLSIGIRIGGGFSVDLLKSGNVRMLPGFDKGYHDSNDVTYMTNYRVLQKGPVIKKGISGEKTLLTRTVEVPSGVPRVVFDYIFSNLPGDAELTLGLPDGRTLTVASPDVLAYEWSESPTLDPEEGRQPIFYEHYVNEGGTQPLKEASFTVMGPFTKHWVNIVDESGNPTGEQEEITALADVPPGTYTITISATHDPLLGEFNPLFEPVAPVLTEAHYSSVGDGICTISWDLDWESQNLVPDEDITVQVYLSNDLQSPEKGIALGPLEGCSWKQGPHKIQFDTASLRDGGFTGPLHLFIKLDDHMNQPEYYHVTSGLLPTPEQTITEVLCVAPIATDGAISVSWQPPLDNSSQADIPGIAEYGILVEEIGTDGSVGEPITTSVLPSQLSATITGLTNGRQYRVTVMALASTTEITKEGESVNVVRPGIPSSPKVVEPVSRAGNNPPRFQSSPITTAKINVPYESIVRVTDPDGDGLVLSIVRSPTSNPPDGMALVLEEDHWKLIYAPPDTDADGDGTPDEVGRYPITLLAVDGLGGEARQTFVLSVVHFGESIVQPVFTTEPEGMVEVGQAYSYAPDVIGLPQESLSQFVLYQGPEEMSVDNATGQLLWTPMLQDVGPHVVTIAVREANPGCASCTGGMLAYVCVPEA